MKDILNKVTFYIPDGKALEEVRDYFELQHLPTTFGYDATYNDSDTVRAGYFHYNPHGKGLFYLSKKPFKAEIKLWTQVRLMYEDSITPAPGLYAIAKSMGYTATEDLDKMEVTPNMESFVNALKINTNLLNTMFGYVDVITPTQWSLRFVSKSHLRTAGWMTLNLQEIIEEFKGGSEDALDGDDVDRLLQVIGAKINLHEGNLTESEYEEALEIRTPIEPKNFYRDVAEGLGFTIEGDIHKLEGPKASFAKEAGLAYMDGMRIIRIVEENNKHNFYFHGIS